MDWDPAEGPGRHPIWRQIWPPSWILPKIRNYEKNGRN